jgi:hypothetical protein
MLQKKIYLPLLIFIVTIFNVNAQIVKFIKNPLTAKYRVFITSQPTQANLFVYKTKKYEEAIGAGLWYIVDNPVLFKNAMTLFEVKSKDEADLIVYFTKKKSEAGYKNAK